MTVKKIILFVFFMFLLMLTITIYGCKTNTGNTSIKTTTADNKTANNTEPDDDKSFPSSIIGTWKKDNFSHTLTFTKDTLKASNQNYTWYFQSVSGNVYKIKPGTYNYTYTITIKLINGNLEISGDTATNSENNWNGTWKKQ